MRERGESKSEKRVKGESNRTIIISIAVESSRVESSNQIGGESGSDEVKPSWKRKSRKLLKVEELLVSDPGAHCIADISRVRDGTSGA